MSGTLPVPQNARDEDSASERGSKEEDESAGSPGTLERGDAPLLHTSDTLEYPGGGRFPVAEETGLEMKALRQASAAEGAQAPPVAAEKGPGPESEVWVPPPAVDPTVRVVVARTLSKESERQAFLTGHCPLPDSEWPGANGEEEGSYGGDMGKRPCCPRCSRPNLKATASLAGAVLVYPCFLYGAYVFLPFDVPIMPDISARLMYTLRCGVFATVPIIMGKEHVRFRGEKPLSWDIMLRLYGTLMRPLLEHRAQFWLPCYRKDIVKLGEDLKKIYKEGF
eukprot:g32360.t1